MLLLATLVVARFPDWLTVSLTLLRFEVEKSFAWLQETEKCRCFRLELQCMGGTLGAAQLTAADCCRRRVSCLLLHHQS